MKNYRKLVPVEFYNEEKAGKPHPTATNVGELIKQLKRLPKELPLDLWGSDAKSLFVANIDRDPFLGFTDTDF